MKTIKRTLAVLLTLLMLMSSIPYVVAEGEATSGQCGDSVYWSYDEETKTLTISGIGEMWNVGSDFERPWENLFIQALVIEDGVTSIGGSSFEGCSSLSSVIFSNSVTSIGWDAFMECSRLTSVTIPDNVTSIGAYAFRDCSSLSEISLGDSVSHIGALAFDNTAYYQDKANWTNGGLYLGYWLLEGGHGEIVEGTQHIAEKAFHNVGGIGPYSPGINSIAIPDSVETIGNFAFQNCNALSSVKIGSGVTHIGLYAFNDTALEEAFYNGTETEWNQISIEVGNDDLTNATIHFTGSEEPVTSGQCGENAFWSYDEATATLTISGTGDMWDYEQRQQPWIAYENDIQTIIIEDGVTSIGAGAFYFCQFLTSIEIGDNVASIGKEAFGACHALTSGKIPEKVTSIGELAFFECSGLTEITFPGSVTSIGENALAFCVNLTSITIYNPDCEINNIIPNGPPYASATIYGYSGSTAQEFAETQGRTFVALDAIPTSGQCGDNAYWTLDENGTLTISGTGDMWDFSPESLASYAMYGQQIVSVVIEEGITGIGEFAFIFPGNGYDESQIGGNLTEVTIPTSVTKIGSAAFSNCYHLQEVTIPDSVTNIGSSAFEYCKALQHVILPANLTALEWGAFLGCTNLLEIEIPESVETIGADEFMLCDSLQKVVFYNPDCVFEDEFEVDDQVFQDRAQYALPEATVIYGYPGSTAQEYAETFGRTFVALDAIPTSGQCGDNAFWSYDEETATLTISGTGKMEPDNDSSFWKWWEQNITKMQKCVIEEGIVNVYGGAFTGAYHLKEVSLPQSLKSIDSGAFMGCTRLTNLVLPEKLETIDYGAFGGCTSLEVLTLPDSITRIGATAFVLCTSLKNIKLPAGLVTLEDSLFAFCTSLETVEIPASVTECLFDEQISQVLGLFTGCFQLKKIINRSSTLVCAEQNYSRASFAEGFDHELYLQYMIALMEEKLLEQILSLFDSSDDSQAYLDERLTELFGEDYAAVLEPITTAVGENPDLTKNLVTGMPEGLTFYCNKNSAEHQYCKDNGVAFKLLDVTDVTDAPTGVGLSYDNDAFEDGTEISITEIDTGSESSRAWNITPTRNGQKVQPSKPVTVRLPIPTGWDKSKLVVVHVDENGNTEYPSFTIEGNYVVFSVSRFSKYSIEQKRDETTSDDSSTDPTTQPQPQPQNVCKWCGKVHEGFFQKIIGFFHKILAAILGAKY